VNFFHWRVRNGDIGPSIMQIHRCNSELVAEIPLQKIYRTNGLFPNSTNIFHFFSSMDGVKDNLHFYSFICTKDTHK